MLFRLTLQVLVYIFVKYVAFQEREVKESINL